MLSKGFLFPSCRTRSSKRGHRSRLFLTITNIIEFPAGKKCRGQHCYQEELYLRPQTHLHFQKALLFFMVLCPSPVVHPLKFIYRMKIHMVAGSFGDLQHYRSLGLMINGLTNAREVGRLKSQYLCLRGKNSYAHRWLVLT